jgi:hypothetical protein
MSEQTKKIIQLILFFTLVAGIGVLLYFVFFQTGQKIAIQPTDEPIATDIIGDGLPSAQPSEDREVSLPPTDGTGLPEIGDVVVAEPTERAEGGLTLTEQLTDEAVQQAILNPSTNNLNFYNSESGKFYQIGDNGELIELSAKTFHNVSQVNWAPNAESSILEYPDGSKLYYNFTTNQQVTLPKYWQEFSFNDNSNEIAFKEIQQSADSSWLSVANPDGSNKRSVKHLGINDDKVTVSFSPNEQIIGYYEEQSGFDQSTVYFVSKADENLRAARVDGYGVRNKWTTDGNRMVYSSYSTADDYIPELWIVDAQGDSIGGNRINLGLNTTADKCTMADSATMYCAVPQDIIPGMGLEPSIANDIADDIYKIDLRTGRKAKIAETDIDATISQLMVNKTQNTLYFVDSENLNLHKMNL